MKFMLRFIPSWSSVVYRSHASWQLYYRVSIPGMVNFITPYLVLNDMVDIAEKQKHTCRILSLSLKENTVPIDERHIDFRFGLHQFEAESEVFQEMGNVSGPNTGDEERGPEESLRRIGAYDPTRMYIQSKAMLNLCLQDLMEKTRDHGTLLFEITRNLNTAC